MNKYYAESRNISILILKNKEHLNRIKKIYTTKLIGVEYYEAKNITS